jgi:hypothetical protein
MTSKRKTSAGMPVISIVSSSLETVCNAFSRDGSTNLISPFGHHIADP